eukprot:SAG11_NODE_994_length_6261_cov_10.558747_8_plen_71_part_00
MYAYDVVTTVWLVGLVLGGPLLYYIQRGGKALLNDVRRFGTHAETVLDALPLPIRILLAATVAMLFSTLY